MQPIDRLLYSQSTNRSENSYVNNITDPVRPLVGNTKFTAAISKPAFTHIMARSDARDIQTYPHSNHFKVNVNKQNVSSVSVQTCVFSGMSEPPPFVLLEVAELRNESGIRDSAGDPNYDATFPLLVKNIGTGVFTADNQIHRYHVDIRNPLFKMPNMTLTFRDGLTSELISPNQWSISVIFRLQCVVPDEV